MSAPEKQNLQDVFLNNIRKNKLPVTVFLVNGVKLQGVITWFDNFSVLLRRDGHAQLVYKHAISTVMPASPIQLFDPSKRRRSTPNKLPQLLVNGIPSPTGRAVVLHAYLKSDDRARGGRDPKMRLAEAVALARAIGLVVVEHALVALDKARPGMLFGEGKVAEIAELIRAGEIGVAIVDGRLTAVQQRNLERAWAAKVIDRTGLILEIFGARARSKEGRLQVELAALSYQLSRLVRSWTHLERQRGGFGFLGGPGESQIEADRRHIRERIARLKHELKAISRTRELHRAERGKTPYPVVALVGYTNAGKSTLFNQLTQADVFADPSLFATLDPTMRGVTLPRGRRAILSDTVGFISDLPTDLVAAFAATLEEVREADVIVHVRDISHPDSDAQKRDVNDVLTRLGIGPAEQTRVIEALNKVDAVDGDARARLVNLAVRKPELVVLSALTGEGKEDLLALLDERLAEDQRIIDLSVAIEDGATIAWLYRHGHVLYRKDDERHAHFRVGLDAANLSRMAALAATQFPSGKAAD